MSKKWDAHVRKALMAEGWEELEVLPLGGDCPWPKGNAGEVAESCFGDLALPRLVKRLTAAVHVCAVHHEDEMTESPWFLVWVLDDETLFMAGPPNPNVKELGGWKAPKPLKELLARHDGIGTPLFEFGWAGFDPGVMPAARIGVPEVPKAKDLLRFTRGWGEAGEGGWCFQGKRKLEIVDVEDRHGLRGEPIADFWEFLDRYLTGEELPEAERF